MEPAGALISRPVPRLQRLNGTTQASISRENISARFLNEWTNFTAEVLTTCASLDLSTHIPATDDTDGSERFAVGSKLGLTGRFSKHVCDAVSKILAVSEHCAFSFGDAQTALPVVSDEVPDLIMIDLSTAQTKLVVKLKTFWTVALERYPVNRGPHRLIPMEPHFGQVVSYMRQHELKYAALSTYRTTVFIKRTGDYRFELSMPVDEKATNPSLRECFLALCALASQEPEYIESPEFCIETLKIPTQPFFQSSTRPSPGRNLISAGYTEGATVGTESILFGGIDGSAHSWVNCETVIQRSKDKAVYEVMWDGQPSIAKCYSESRFESYADEATTYERLYQERPEGFEFFASLLSHGKIACSSIFPTGYILIITKSPGRPLIEQWSDLVPHQKSHVYSQIEKAIYVLRDLSIISVDSGMHNILYCPMTERVTMHDFELMQVCDEVTINTSMPEMFAIFGEFAVDEGHRHPGG